MRFVKWIAVGTHDPETRLSGPDHEADHRCLADQPRGRTIGPERSFSLLAVADHQVVLQSVTYHPPADVVGCVTGAGLMTDVEGLGFSTDDSHGNFSLDRDVGDDPDYMALADLMLGALYVGYGARADMNLKIDAPFAPLPNSTCDPTS